jgi:HPt (histidine-containing phosphotransfer) domain-containing protein
MTSSSRVSDSRTSEGGSPIDRAHLARQTMGDAELEREVLALFLEQAATTSADIAGSTVGKRLHLAHALKGSAQAVGAFAVADCAAGLERDPGDTALLSRLDQLIAEVRSYVAQCVR